MSKLAGPAPYSVAIIQLDSMALEGSKHRLQACLVESPSAHGAGMDGLANLYEAGRAHDARIRIKLEAGWIPRETDEVDQATCVSFQIGDQLFVLDLERGEGRVLFPVFQHALIVRQPPRDVIPIVIPGACAQDGLPA